MQHQNHAATLPAQRPQQLHQRKLAGEIQIGGGLVQQHHCRLLGEHHGEVGALPFAAGEPAHGPVHKRTEFHALDGCLNDLPILPAQALAPLQVRVASVGHQMPHADVWRDAALGHVGQVAGALLLGDD